MSTPEKEPIPAELMDYLRNLISERQQKGHGTSNIILGAEIGYEWAYEHLPSQPSPGLRLDIAAFSKLSAERAEMGFKTYRNVPITYWTTALMGEGGELCNMIKKMERVAHGGIDGGSSYTAASLSKADLAEEIGGIFIYLNILSGLLDIDMGEAIIETFNSKSKKYGFPQFYPSTPTASDNCVYPEGGGEGEEKRSADPWYLLKYVKDVLEREFPVEDIIDFIGKKLNERSRATPAPEAQPIAPYPKGYIPTGTELPGTHYAEGCGTELIVNEQPIADGKEVPEPIRCVCVDSIGDDAGCTHPRCDKYAHQIGRLMRTSILEQSAKTVISDRKGIEQLQSDLLAARNKNNDDGIEIARLLAEKKEYAVNEQKIGRNLLDAYRVISGLLPANSQWQEKYIHKCNDLTVMIDEALQKGKELDALAPEIKRQTIDRLYNEILAAGVEFPPAAREVFHRAMNELTASPTQNSNK